MHQAPPASPTNARHALAALPFLLAAPGFAALQLTGRPLASLSVVAGVAAVGVGTPSRARIIVTAGGLIGALALAVAVVGAHPEWPYLLGALPVALVLAGVMALVRRHDQNRLQAARRDLQAAEARTVLDPLTGLANRQGLSLLAAPMMEHARRAGDAVHCVVVAVDGLAAVSGTMGPQACDDILVAAAAALRSVTRGTDVVGRWDGSELIVVGPGAGMSMFDIERRVRERLKEQPPVDVASWEPKVTAGGAVLAPWDEGDLDSLVRKANVETHARRALRSTASRRRQANAG